MLISLISNMYTTWCVTHRHGCFQTVHLHTCATLGEGTHIWYSSLEAWAIPRSFVVLGDHLEIQRYIPISDSVSCSPPYNQLTDEVGKIPLPISAVQLHPCVIPSWYIIFPNRAESSPFLLHQSQIDLYFWRSLPAACRAPGITPSLKQSTKPIHHPAT
jgi:hypothetical protein